MRTRNSFKPLDGEELEEVLAELRTGESDDSPFLWKEAENGGSNHN